jgi:DNA polymerase-1
MLIAIDFESHGIEDRPKYPPIPVGVAIYEDGGTPRYLAWGHPTQNNCTEATAVKELRKILSNPDDEFIFHNAPFDCAILEERLDIKVPWKQVHDTMVLAFLQDPFGELSLKPLAAQWLQMPPDERDAVKDWLIKHGVCRDTKGWGAYICKAPGELVGTYAVGDVVRTLQLFKLTYEYATSTNMLNAYQREIALMPHVLKMEQRGLKLDGELLSKDVDYYFGALDDLDQDICKLLGRQVDIDSGAQLADAIEAAGMSKGFATTPTGLRSTAKESLINAINNPTLLGHLLVRGSVATCLRTFMTSWLTQYNEHGRLYVKWNLVRNYSDTGARTGRISSSPNLQNIPVEWEGLRAQLDRIGYTLPFPLPQVRKYIIPDAGKVFIDRDYSAQELRLLTHFAPGKLLAELEIEPTADIHQIAAKIAGISRKEAKTLAFAVLYGAGVGKIAESLHMTVAEATRVKEQYLKALPEIKELTKRVQDAGKNRSFITTLGGRQYYAQKPAVVKGVWKSFEYKLTNYLIQGSAADATKQAMLDYCQNTKHGELVLTVHDELVIQADAEHSEAESKLLESMMNGSFQETLKYKVISTGSKGHNFAEASA